MATPTVEYKGQAYEIVKEGQAEILKPRSAAQDGEPANQSVFYNPIQQFNRDLSVLAIRAFGEDLTTIRRLRKEKQSHRQGHGGQRGKKRKRTSAVEDDSRGVQVRDTPVDQAPSAPVDPQDSVAAKPIFRILDALSATGLRALRYAKEIPMASSVTANDISSAATASIQLNVQHNGVGNVVKPTTGDARAHMYASASSSLHADQRLYQVIDLDPYGTAAPFLDAALQALADGGLLCVTCTDAGVFASVGYLEKTYSQYGGLPFKGSQSHEGGLRLILHTVATSAARYGVAIEPLLSLSIDFYARLFIRVKKSPAEVKLLAGKTMLVYNCDTGCGAWTTQFLAQIKNKTAKNGDPIYKFSLGQAPSASPHCEHCGFKTHLSGPMWGGPLHNPWFAQKILDMLPALDGNTYATIPRIEGMLTMARDEAILDEIAESPNPDRPSPKDSSQRNTENPTSAPLSVPFPSLPPSVRANHPFFIIPSQLAGIIHCTSPPDAGMRGALMHLGYRTSRSHTKPGSIATDAPWNVIWEVMREYARQKAPIKEGSLKPGTAGWGIMAKARDRNEFDKAKAEMAKVIEDKNNTVDELKKGLEAVLYRMSNLSAEDGEAGGDTSSLTVNFDEALGKDHGKKLVRYQANPRADWGPMNKASG